MGLNTGGKYCCSYYQHKVIDDNLKLKTELFVPADYSY